MLAFGSATAYIYIYMTSFKLILVSVKYVMQMYINDLQYVVITKLY